MFKWFIVLLGCCLAMSMAGCMKARMHIMVNADGSADFEYTMALNRDDLGKMQASMPSANQQPLPKPGEISRQMAEGAEKEAKANGMTVTPYQDGAFEGIKLTKHAKDMKEAMAVFNEMQSTADQQGSGSMKGANLGLEVKKGFFMDSYKLNMTLTKEEGGDAMGQAMMSQMSKTVGLQFALTLPVKPSKTNAATTENGGKTLIWDIDPSKDTKLEAEARQFRFVNIGIVGAAGLLALFAILGIALRKKSM